MFFFRVFVMIPLFLSYEGICFQNLTLKRNQVCHFVYRCLSMFRPSQRRFLKRVVSQPCLGLGGTKSGLSKADTKSVAASNCDQKNLELNDSWTNPMNLIFDLGKQNKKTKKCGCFFSQKDDDKLSLWTSKGAGGGTTPPFLSWKVS